MVLLVVIVCFSLMSHCVIGQTSLSEADKQEILNAHNHFRSIVNPTASNMEEMVQTRKCLLYITMYGVISLKSVYIQASPIATTTMVPV